MFTSGDYVFFSAIVGFWLIGRLIAREYVKREHSEEECKQYDKFSNWATATLLLFFIMKTILESWKI